MKINPKKQITKKYKTHIGYLEGTISIILNTLLFALKYWVGIETFSIAIIADAWHTLSDSLTSVVVIIGGVLIQIYKIYWIDPVITVLISIYIIRSGFVILKQSCLLYTSDAADE